MMDTARWALVRTDRGSVTIEAAFGLAALVTVAALIIGGMATLASYLSAVDAAGAAARAYAIGTQFQPASQRVQVRVSESGGLVTAQASVDTVFGQLTADAVFPAEIGARQ